MAKLILSFEGMVLKTIVLNKERMTIGRKPENDIQVDNLAVSGLHAVVTTVLNDSVIEDQGSTNGTSINGELVQKHLLKHNDVIELGKHKLKYFFEAAPVTPYTNFEKTMVIRRPNNAAPAATPKANDVPMQAPAVTTAPVAQAPAAVALQAPAPRDGVLQILSGAGAGRTMELTKNLTTIGKTGVQVVVFTRRPVGFFVTHVEGKIFPLVNGESLDLQARQLNDNDTIEIGGTKMRFFYKPELSNT